MPSPSWNQKLFFGEFNECRIGGFAFRFSDPPLRHFEMFAIWYPGFGVKPFLIAFASIELACQFGKSTDVDMPHAGRRVRSCPIGQPNRLDPLAFREPADKILIIAGPIVVPYADDFFDVVGVKRKIACVAGARSLDQKRREFGLYLLPVLMLPRRNRMTEANVD